MASENQLFTDKEASEMLRISKVTLWRIRKKGKIEFRRIGEKVFYTKQDIDNYLENQKRAAYAQK